MVQCSNIIIDDPISIPHKFDKVKELGYEYYIDEMYGLCDETILIINQFKNELNIK